MEICKVTYSSSMTKNVFKGKHAKETKLHNLRIRTIWLWLASRNLRRNWRTQKKKKTATKLDGCRQFFAVLRVFWEHVCLWLFSSFVLLVFCLFCCCCLFVCFCFCFFVFAYILLSAAIAQKNKLITNNTSDINTEIKVNGQKLETVTSFKYLGSVITGEGSKTEILSRIAQTTAA